MKEQNYPFDGFYNLRKFIEELKSVEGRKNLKENIEICINNKPKPEKPNNRFKDNKSQIKKF